jgi:hypothetical protein
VDSPGGLLVLEKPGHFPIVRALKSSFWGISLWTWAAPFQEAYLFIAGFKYEHYWHY